MEQWRVLQRLPMYEVSNLGRVRSIKKGKERLLKQCLASSGYHLVCLSDNKKGSTNYVHRLVAEVFIPIDDINRAVVNHKDKNRLNNSIENLEWVTHTENMFHRDDVKLYSQYRTIEKLCHQMSPAQLEKLITFGRSILVK